MIYLFTPMKQYTLTGSWIAGRQKDRRTILPRNIKRIRPPPHPEAVAADAGAVVCVSGSAKANAVNEHGGRFRQQSAKGGAEVTEADLGALPASLPNSLSSPLLLPASTGRWWRRLLHATLRLRRRSHREALGHG